MKQANALIKLRAATTDRHHTDQARGKTSATVDGSVHREYGEVIDAVGSPPDATVVPLIAVVAVSTKRNMMTEELSRTPPPGALVLRPQPSWCSKYLPPYRWTLDLSSVTKAPPVRPIAVLE